MIKIENIEVNGLKAAIRGMRNPMNSWEKSDSYCCTNMSCDSCSENKKSTDTMCEHIVDDYIVGPNDHNLMMKLAQGGPVQAKYRRMIIVYMDIVAPLYWWKEFDTYKVGTVANSCSTMHKIQAKEFTLNDFSHEHLYEPAPMDPPITEGNINGIGGFYNCTPLGILQVTINTLNRYRKMFLQSNRKEDWWQMIQLLPSSYNQRRTVMLNYEVLADIYRSGRKDHKLDEWRDFCNMIKGLPYSEIITEKFEKEKK